MNEDTRPLMVTIRCTAYNHEPYIRQCLEGFVMQKTNFRFEAIVHDDASTDGTAAIVREYAEKYPDIIKPIYETENQYSKGDGSLQRIMDEYTHGKYVALCEGDDYWIDPLKLQKQYDLMETHPEYSLCFHAHNRLYPDGSIKHCTPALIKKVYEPDDVIIHDGGFMATCSMFYRTYSEKTPDFILNCHVGDLPIMLYNLSKGNFIYIDETMSVYRYMTLNSWTAKLQKMTINELFVRHKNTMQMYTEYDEYTNKRYCKIIQKRKSQVRLINIKRLMKMITHEVVVLLKRPFSY